jgi:hypothetical protein
MRKCNKYNAGELYFTFIPYTEIYLPDSQIDLLESQKPIV